MDSIDKILGIAAYFDKKQTNDSTLAELISKVSEITVAEMEVLPSDFKGFESDIDQLEHPIPLKKIIHEIDWDTRKFEGYFQLDSEKLKILLSVNIQKRQEYVTLFKHCFKKLDETQTVLLLNLINKTAWFLYIFDKYHMDENRKWEQKRSLVKKYEAVIEDIKKVAMDVGSNNIKITIKMLEDRVVLLKKESIFITRRNIFENLLYCTNKIVLGGKNPPKGIPEDVLTLVNKIIRCYFDKDVSFSRAAKIQKYDRVGYALGRKIEKLGQSNTGERFFRILYHVTSAD